MHKELLLFIHNVFMYCKIDNIEARFSEFDDSYSFDFKNYESVKQLCIRQSIINGDFCEFIEYKILDQDHLEIPIYFFEQGAEGRRGPEEKTLEELKKDFLSKVDFSVSRNKQMQDLLFILYPA